MSRTQVGIERLGNRRMSNNEPRESMNCKSCRKRKIKCNRLRPTCEACTVFQCPCVYDAVPKKRGPKTDVLEALLKRVDGLERRLKEEKKSISSPSPEDEAIGSANGSSIGDAMKLERPQQETITVTDEVAVYSPSPTSAPSPTLQAEVLIDTYFSRVHGKPYYILDETTTRQKASADQLPEHLAHAINAVSSRYATHPSGFQASLRLSEDYAAKARDAIDLDEPTIDSVKTLLLLAVSFLAAGRGKKAYMMLSNAVAMAVALGLHREQDAKLMSTPADRETRRRLFWTCYLMDRFVACGSKRPSFITDESILLHLPSWIPSPGATAIEGEFFQNGSNLQYHSGSGKKSQGSSGMLIDIVRILGITNRYLAAGGVKGDSHFPWHSLSNLSKVRQDLDVWASGTQDAFSSIDALFGQPDSTSLVLSKLIYHLIHCLIYRPFLPIDLAELAGTGQHQSWQIEATNLCFLHANAISELVELGKQSIAIEWPAFVGYCICTAGTVHVHGAHYKAGREGDVFANSGDFLAREMQQLSDLRYIWASVQHQRDTLQTIYNCHSDLVRSLSSNPMRYSPVFHLEDFFDRYESLGQSFDGAHISFTDTTVEANNENHVGHSLYAPRSNSNSDGQIAGTKRKASSSSRKKSSATLPSMDGQHGSTLISPTTLNERFHNISGPIHSQLAQPAHSQHLAFDQNQALSHAAFQHFPSMPPDTTSHFSQMPFSPAFSFSPMPQHQDPSGFDPVFGMPQIPQGPYGYDMNGNPISTVMTPGGQSSGSGRAGGTRSSVGGEEEKDPFLTLLEQLAENEHISGGHSELDFFLAGAQQ